MDGTKLQYKCEQHGIQESTMLINIKLADGNVHSLNHCLVCLAEMLARNGVKAMAPIVQVAETEVKDEWELPS